MEKTSVLFVNILRFILIFNLFQYICAIARNVFLITIIKNA